MDLETLKESIKKNVYHIDSSKNIPLHKHEAFDEVFYCISGSGYGVLENGLEELSHGKSFIVPAMIMHSLRTDTEMVVASFLIPLIK